MALILTRHNVTGNEHAFPESALPTWRALGWIPVTEADTESSTADEATAAASTEPPAAQARRTRAATPEETTR